MNADKQYLATIDIGTSFLKAGIYDKDGNIHGQIRHALKPLSFNHHQVEQDHLNLLAALQTVITALTTIIPSEDWAALSLVSQRDTLMLLDHDKPLTPLISWLDRRGIEIGGDRWDWFNAYSQVVKHTTKIRSIMSLITEKLTGTAYDTIHTAPPEWDLNKHPEQHSYDGPKIVKAGTLIPCEYKEHEFTDLIPAELPLIICGGDKNCEFLGNGCAKPNIGVLSLGTALSLGTIYPGTVVSSSPGTFITPIVIDDYCQVEIGIRNAGKIWQWFAKNFNVTNLNPLKIKLPEVDSKLFFQPYISGSLYDLTNQACITGMSYDTNINEIVAATLEGIICELLRGKQSFDELGIVLDHILVGRGPHEEPYITLLQWLADAFQCDVGISNEPTPGLAGTAAIAAKSLGWYPQWAQAVAAYAPKVNEWLTHDPAKHAHWQQRLQQFMQQIPQQHSDANTVINKEIYC